jgi:hypothetical protein
MFSAKAVPPFLRPRSSKVAYCGRDAAYGSIVAPRSTMPVASRREDTRMTFLEVTKWSEWMPSRGRRALPLRG